SGSAAGFDRPRFGGWMRHNRKPLVGDDSAQVLLFPRHARHDLTPKAVARCHPRDYLRLRECLPPRQPVRCRGGGFGMFSAASGSIAMKRFAVAAICTVCLVGYAMSAEFTMTLKSIDNDTLVGTKKKKGAKKG